MRSRKKRKSNHSPDEAQKKMHPTETFQQKICCYMIFELKCDITESAFDFDRSNFINIIKRETGISLSARGDGKEEEEDDYYCNKRELRLRRLGRMGGLK